MNKELKETLVMAAFVVFIIAVIIFCVVALEIKQGRAEDRCHAKGGVTWDSGKHCILRDFTTIDTT